MRRAPPFRCLFAMVALLVGCGDPDLVAPGALEYLTAPVAADRKPGPLRLAAVALPVARDKSANLARIETTVDAIVAGDPAVRLIHLGEATLGWYETSHDPAGYQRTIAEPLTGPAATFIRGLARRHGVYLAWGMMELADERLYNSLVVADPNGEIAGVHRKMLLFEADVRAGVTEAAPNVQILDIAGLRVGLMICYDGKSEWLQHQLTGRGADLVLLSIASDMQQADVSPTARRLGTWLSVANRHGIEDGYVYSGNAYISDPNGTVVAETHDDAGSVRYAVGAQP